MTHSERVFVAGHTGMVGSAIVRALSSPNPANTKYEVITAPRRSLDCIDQRQVDAFVASTKPDALIIAAARVGGIHANDTYPAEFAYQNLMIEANLIHAAHAHGVQRLIFLGSSCIYPKHANQPMREDALLTGPLEPTNEPYAVAKIAGIKLCESYNRQHGRDYRCLMPTNLYGPNDNYHPDNSHVVPSLIHRMHVAKTAGHDQVEVWGTGRVSREMLYVDDLAAAVLFALDLPLAQYAAATTPQRYHLNVGTGVDVTIAELAEQIRQVVGFEGQISYDTSRPDGAPRKLLDVSAINKLGWQAKVSLSKGLMLAYEWYLANQQQVRHT